MNQTGPLDDIMRSVAVPPKNGQWMPLATMLRRHSLKVDLVAEQERVWIKVIARNTKAFRLDMAGMENNIIDDDDDLNDFDDDNSDISDIDESSKAGIVNVEAPSFDELPIFKKARAYLTCAQAHSVHFKTPIVVFAFMRIHRDQDPFVQRIMDQLEHMGICIYLQDQQDIRSTYMPVMKQVFGVGQLPKLDAMYALTTPKLNLDVSTVLAMVSELSHHVCGVDQVEGEALQLQAAQEMTEPIIPQLERILHGKQLFMTQSAFDRLESIMAVVAGPMEKQRYHYLFPSTSNDNNKSNPHVWTSLTPPSPITVIPDQPTTRFTQLLEPPKGGMISKLNNGRKIRSRFSSFHAIIFGTADHHQMTTITAIQWMPTALAEAGLLGSAIITHPPRSLAEQKMHTSNDS
ncbi:uncharacterized protein BX664DRAFT_323397 [Halteromyces radiatus]|uniref:uncharacterized protein n=1 Tax=Halteromyces radiatus TaxID=101107 RepID=UPI0022209161|nr:uncharacterized protein BX664DRAFT_323397 [Halteromyces radiatus]KAI8096213.1 hypothetical protein BX664DRAFT_323397 [Halteromyces radiatus]